VTPQETINALADRIAALLQRMSAVREPRKSFVKVVVDGKVRDVEIGRENAN